MSLTFIALFVVTLFCHIARSVYDIYKLNQKGRQISSTISGLMVPLTFMMWAAWVAMSQFDRGFANLQPMLKNIGLGFSCLGLMMFFYALYRLKSYDDYQGVLIQDGLFMKIRHPMYLGFIFILLGYPVYQNAKYTLITAIIWVPNVLYWRKIEERRLEEKYPEYLNYKSGTLF